MQPRRSALVHALVLLLLTAAVVAAALVSQQWVVAQAARAVPGEGFHWSVAQYQIAHQRLKQELRAAAAGEPADPQAIAQRWAVLASRASILSEPSAVNTLLKDVKGFAGAASRINEMHRQIAPLLDQANPLSRADAQQVLHAFNSADDEALLSQLGNDARQAELVAKEALVATLSQRLSWVWIGFGLCWTVLALWLLSAVRSARRYAQAATDRQQALNAMTQAVNTKRSFLSMVSHELRSPLQSIVTATESIKQDIALGQSRPQSAVAVQRIQRATMGLQTQLRDLLTLARSDSEGPGLQQEIFEPSALVRDVCAEYEDAALAKSLVLNVTLPEQTQLVHADPIRMAQVLRNLLENAVRYTGEGRIDVQLHDDGEVNPDDPMRYLRFSVSDSGPGMPAAALERLRSNDVTFEARHDSPQDGMRIGLFVIRDVLRQLAGDIEVSSNPGQGTRAHVRIPVRAAPAEERSEAGPAPSGGVGDWGDGVVGADRLRILVVDDDTGVLEALSAAAQALGHGCDVAASGHDAMPLLAGTRYDAVLLDLDMPGMTGLELARSIRATRSKADGHTSASEASLNAGAMLILITAPDNRELGCQPPFDGFLAKPVTRQALNALIGSRTMH